MSNVHQIWFAEVTKVEFLCIAEFCPPPENTCTSDLSESVGLLWKISFCTTEITNSQIHNLNCIKICLVTHLFTDYMRHSSFLITTWQFSDSKVREDWFVQEVRSGPREKHITGTLWQKCVHTVNVTYGKTAPSGQRSLHLPHFLKWIILIIIVKIYLASLGI